MEDKEKKPPVKMTPKRIAALLVVVLLVCMYLITLIAALFDPSSSGRLFALCLFATMVIPIMAWLYIYMYDRLKGKPTIGDPVLPPEEEGSASEEAGQTQAAESTREENEAK